MRRNQHSNMDLYVQYGCGLSAPESWTNFDASPTLRIQKTPVIGALLKSRLNAIFPSNVKYGDIVSGLPVKDNSCKGVYCSHVLEHLSLNDFRKALKNTYRILEPGGIFRCVVPDLEAYAKRYLNALESGDENASLAFVGQETLFGVKDRPRGVKGIISNQLGNSRHLWMWDSASMKKELKEAGFTDIRDCSYNDCSDPAFSAVEDRDRFYSAVAVECRK